MCGIAGVYGRSESVLVSSMLDALQHRGPDARGITDEASRDVTLGHTRLSIIDLEGGDQPLHGPDGTKLVANGEIYNARQLRERLGADRFSTGSDNEAILHLIDAAGVAATADLRGMYAFALFREGELVLGRDPVGIKPLYLGRSEDDLVLASELKALPPGVSNTEPLAPGTVWSSLSGTHRFWSVPEPPIFYGSFKPLGDHVATIRAELSRAVQRRMISDVPVGAFLSGGLDSSAIAALMRPHVAELHTFSVGLPGSTDLEAARMVSEHLDTIHHEYLLDPAEIRACLPEIVHSLESFDLDLVRSAVPTFFTARLASQHVKVVLTGEGADELFAGYTYHKALTDERELDADLRRSVAELHHVNLQRVDRLTMAHSLEARVPFLDIDLIEAALAVPVALRRPGVLAAEKGLLRAAVADLLPDDVLWRDKSQFDQGTGIADLLPAMATETAAHIDVQHYRDRYPNTRFRSPEECRYHEMLVESLADPEPILENVARWSER
ncbi:MAG: asparagine synthase-related protein [Microthrixaceae bacterium]